MGIEELTCWKTSDGKLFENRNMAVVHETELNGWKDANAVYTSGGSVADALRAGGYKYNIDRILENVTNKTRLCIPHWQCSDVPGYTPIISCLVGVCGLVATLGRGVVRMVRKLA